MAKLFYVINNVVNIINVINNAITFKMSLKSMTFEAVCHAKYQL